MSFLTILNQCCIDYTQFTYEGMTIKLPYYLGGKHTPDAIRAKISEWIGTSNKTKEAIQEHVTANAANFGIDCSGFVYYALNEATNGAVREYFESMNPSLAGKLSYAWGISAANLAGASYGTRINMAKDIKPGCTIRTDNGGHVIVVHSVNRNSAGEVTSIVYAHSNGSMGPHHGFITIGDETKDLDHASQTWVDGAYTDSQAKNLYTYTVLLEPVAEFVE